MKYRVSAQVSPRHIPRPTTRSVTARSHLRAAEIAAHRMLDKPLGGIVATRASNAPKTDGLFTVKLFGQSDSVLTLYVEQQP